MSNWLAIPLLIFVLIILGDGVAALLGARTCWRLRKKARLALPFAVVLMALALSSMNDIVNELVNLQGAQLPKEFLIQRFIGRALRAAATWYLALKLMGGS